MWKKNHGDNSYYCNIKDKLRAQIESALQTDKKPWWQAAQFYNEYDHNSTKALDYANKSDNGQSKSILDLLYKAKIQKELGDNTGAMESSKNHWSSPGKIRMTIIKNERGAVEKLK